MKKQVISALTAAATVVAVMAMVNRVDALKPVKDFIEG